MTGTRDEERSMAHSPENDFARCEVRQLLYGRYRILYTVRDETAFSLTVRHGARRFLSGPDADETE